MLGAVLEASQFDVGGHVPSDADYEQVTESLIKNDFRRDSRIRATQNFGVRMLAGHQLPHAFYSLVWMLITMLDVPSVTGFQLGQD